MASARWSGSALQDIEGLDSFVRERILTKVSWLEDNIRNIAPEPLHYKLKGLYKVRVGDYRIEYSVQNNIILIEAIGHRRDIYR